MAEENDKGAKEPKVKKSKGRKKEEVRKAGFAANIEEGLEVKPARLKLRFRKDIVPALLKELGLKNPHQVPRLEVPAGPRREAEQPRRRSMAEVSCSGRRSRAAPAWRMVPATSPRISAAPAR